MASIAEKQQAAVDGLAFTPRCPSWIKAEVGHKPVLIEERAATVRRIFQLAADGIGLQANREYADRRRTSSVHQREGGTGSHLEPGVHSENPRERSGR